MLAKAGKAGLSYNCVMANYSDMAGRGSIVGIRLAGATVTMTGIMLGWKGKKTVVHCNVNILESKKNIIQESRTVVES